MTTPVEASRLETAWRSPLTPTPGSPVAWPSMRQRLVAVGFVVALGVGAFGCSSPDYTNLASDLG